MTVSGKTDYLIAGSILEDGRAVEEGSKHRKCVEMWELWADRWRGEYDEGGDNHANENGSKGKATGRQQKDKDPNTLVQIVHGIYEFYGLLVFLSDWKKGTMSRSEQLELEAKQQPLEETEKGPVGVDAGTPSTSPSNRRARSAASASKAVTNPYAKKSSTPTANPYARKSSPANPYARKSPAAPDPRAGADSSAAVAPSKSDRRHPSARGSQLNSLWADRYAPATSREILGNADSVNKLSRWLSGWEGTFNDPRREVKSISAPGGPRKAALLSGPPGIGEFPRRPRRPAAPFRSPVAAVATLTPTPASAHPLAKGKPPPPRWWPRSRAATSWSSTPPTRAGRRPWAWRWGTSPAPKC